MIILYSLIPSMSKMLLSVNLVTSLIIGFNYNFSTYINPLHNCINDAHSYSNIFKKEEIITDDKFTVMFQKHRLTKKYFETKFDNMLAKKTKTGNIKILTFSGHGDFNIAARYESIIFPTCEEFTDKDFDRVIRKYNDYKLICIFDSCFSGSILNLPYVYEVKLNMFITKYRTNYKKYNNVKIIQLSSCQDYKISSEVPSLHKHGLFTENLITYLEDNKDKTITYEHVLRHLHRQMLPYRQHPVMSSTEPLDLNKEFLTF